MVEYTQEAMPGTIEVVRPVAPGDGVVRADEDAAAGAELVPAGRPLRAQDLGMLAAAGVTERDACTPGRGWRSSPPATRWCRPAPRRCGPARCATRRRSRWPRMVAEAGGEPVAARHRARRPRGAGVGAVAPRSPPATWS